MKPIPCALRGMGIRIGSHVDLVQPCGARITLTTKRFTSRLTPEPTVGGADVHRRASRRARAAKYLSSQEAVPYGPR